MIDYDDCAIGLQRHFAVPKFSEREKQAIVSISMTNAFDDISDIMQFFQLHTRTLLK